MNLGICWRQTLRAGLLKSEGIIKNINLIIGFAILQTCQALGHFLISGNCAQKDIIYQFQDLLLILTGISASAEIIIRWAVIFQLKLMGIMKFELGEHLDCVKASVFISWICKSLAILATHWVWRCWCLYQLSCHDEEEHASFCCYWHLDTKIQFLGYQNHLENSNVLIIISWFIGLPCLPMFLLS